MKTCSKCKKNLPLHAFNNEHASPDKLAHWCRECMDNNRKHRRRIETYGLSNESFLTILESQKSECAICGESLVGKKQCLDHNHKTLAIRGILCTNCNFMIGYAGEDQVILQNAIAYLIKHTGLKPTLGQMIDLLGHPTRSYITKRRVQ